jgi:hypothetical protein
MAAGSAGCTAAQAWNPDRSANRHNGPDHEAVAGAEGCGGPQDDAVGSERVRVWTGLDPVSCADMVQKRTQKPILRALERGLGALLATVGLAITAGAQSTSPPTPPATPSPAHRWLDLQVAQLDARFRLIETSAGERTSSQLQHRQLFRTAITFDARKRYALVTGVSTGTGFTSSWDATGLGRGGDPAWHLHLRQLFLQARPWTGVELQVGGLVPVRGETTETTSYDLDAYLVGERVSIKRPRDLHVDEITATLGYLGDLTTPNVLRRLDHLDRHNFTEILVAKSFTPRVSSTIAWSDLNGVDTLREAVRLTTRELRIVDAVRLELYQRGGAASGQGGAIAAEKALTPRLIVSGGYADIDSAAPTINGDRYFRGRRLFTEARVTLADVLTVSAFYTHAVGNDFPVPNARRFDLVASYNVLKALQRAGVW